MKPSISITIPSSSASSAQPTEEKSTSSTSSYGWTNEQFEEFLHTELQKDPLYAEYSPLFDVAPKCISKWRQRYRGHPSLWKRLFQKDRVIKEFIEAAPIIDAVQRLVENSIENDEKFTIIDLACGRGYLSMFLSELLPPSKVEKFVLVDKQWPMHSDDIPPQPHHISWTHIYGSFKKTEDQSIPSYYETWPIPLNTSKQNLKSGRELRKLEQLYFHTNTKNPIILVAVHLCGTLSMKAVELFNRNPETTRFLCLKPCCLPGMIHAQRHETFQLGQNHTFDAKLVCMAGKWKKNIWRGPPRSQLKSFFQRWAENLFLGIDTDGDTTPTGATTATTTKKIQKTIMVQSNGGYQNEFLFAERLPTTEPLWEQLCKPCKVKEEEDE